MSETKPTPGPGHREGFRCGCRVAVGMESVSLAYCPMHRAAPELLETLKEATADYAHMCDEDSESDGAMLLRKMRAAIAQAEGR